MSEQNFYDPKAIEREYYEFCEKMGYFEPDFNLDSKQAASEVSSERSEAVIESKSDIESKKAQKRVNTEKKGNFAIMLPPPNVTGSLHIGHALNHTLIDIIVRYKRMDGYRVLWQPGLDHAGIATQNVVEKQLLAQGIKKEEIGREEFLKKVWEWKEKSGGTILSQMRKLGSSPAWKRTRFTMDSGLQNAVKAAFCKLYNEKLIIQGEYLVNWCTHDGALSDIEVEYKENNGFLYHLRYYFADPKIKLNGKNYIVLATTRPETYFGDSAVMVNPNDNRFSEIIGAKVILPIINREIPIIADEIVDMEFGSGAVKVTPAHDVNDYEVGKRHNLEQIVVFDKYGILNENANIFAGRERLEARDEIVQKLQDLGAIEQIEPYTNQVGRCYRCGNVIEPYISKQWFLKKEAAKKAIEKINDDKSQSKFFPPTWKNNYNAWMRELRDWCISRQLWWGHRIPVFYCECGAQWADCGELKDQVCPKCGAKANSDSMNSADSIESNNFKCGKISQDPDVLDTWFSSALWPFSTLGWGNENALKNEKWEQNDMRDFYPNALLITGFDILFFWVARMLMMGEHFCGSLPFYDIYLHALVRDKDGQKMSKSKGNVIDPLCVIESHSADILRFTLALACAQGRDVRLIPKELDLSKNFTNKLYNAVNYLLMEHSSFEDLENLISSKNIKTPLGQYFLEKFSNAIIEFRNNLEAYRFNDAASNLYSFLWDEFCDWGIELSKADKSAINELGAIFKEAMKLLHPYMPFISDFLWHRLDNSELETSGSIMIQKFPNFEFSNAENFKFFEYIKSAIISLRRAKASVDLGNAKIQKAFLRFNNFELKEQKEEFCAFVCKLAKIENLEITNSAPSGCVVDITDILESFVPTENINLEPIISRLEKNAQKSEAEISKLEKMLSNEKFVKNAPLAHLEACKQNLEAEITKLQKTKAELNTLNSAKGK